MGIFGNSIQARVAGKGLKYLWNKSKPFTIAVVVVVGAVNVAYYIKRYQRRKKWNDVGQDIVVLHMFPRGRFCPNLSPFVLKLETYLRMAEVPYQVDFEEPLGPKGKSPWISLNGEEIGDSQLIMEMLGPKYGKDFSSHLSTEQLAIARAMRIMIEDHFLWCLAVWRFDVDAGKAFLNSIEAPYILRFVIALFRRRIVGASRVQGLGRHSHEEVMEMGRKDLKALSLCLGEKPFLMGDKPTEVDCALFGFLAQVVWNSAGSPYLQMLETECINLQAYCHRIKERYWPDWGQCLNPPQSQIIQ